MIYIVIIIMVTMAILIDNKLGLNNSKSFNFQKRKEIKFNDQLAETTLFVSTLYKNDHYIIEV